MHDIRSPAPTSPYGSSQAVPAATAPAASGGTVINVRSSPYQLPNATENRRRLAGNRESAWRQTASQLTGAASSRRRLHRELSLARAAGTVADENRMAAASRSPAAIMQPRPVLEQPSAEAVQLNNMFWHTRDPGAAPFLNNVLLEAAQQGNASITLLLLRNGADQNVRDNKGRNAMMIAIESKRYEVVDMLWSFGADIHARDNDQNTPLIYAAAFKSESLIRKLRYAGAHVDARNRFGSTALMVACERNSPVSVRALLDNNIANFANVNICNRYQQTPLFFALLVRDRIAAQPQPRRRCICDPWQEGASCHPRYGWARENTEVIAALHQAGLNLNARSSLGRTLLELAEINHDIELVRLLCNTDATGHVWGDVFAGA